ncbi:hypothetical protein [Mangrovibacterium lignilyticum]|uniref:hypothetical protein n=1 Tax=Mangrovibacterium lignilyticum TaxID=2668052 RepID=UPI0013D6F0A2|nr:hypothetical protein [Mangrovibacterium lignilyticum]
MYQIPIKVESHSGNQTGEYPVEFFWNKLRFVIIKITDRWYQMDVGGKESVANYFKICTKSGLYFIMKHDTRTRRWYLIAPEDKNGLLTLPYDRLN